MKKTISLSIEQEVVDSVRKLANQEERSISWMVEKILKEYFKNKEGNK